MKAITTPPGCWRERYESLRRHFLEQPRRLEAVPLGLTVLERDGVARWMQVWSEVAPPASAPAPGLRPKTLPLPPQVGVQLQLALLLAQMTAAHLPTLISR